MVVYEPYLASLLQCLFTSWSYLPVPALLLSSWWALCFTRCRSVLSAVGGNDWVMNAYLGAWQRARIRGEERGALSCVGGLFRLGFCKLLHEQVENPKPFHPPFSQETATALSLLLMVHVVKMLLPRLFLPPPPLPPPTTLVLSSLWFDCAPLPRIEIVYIFMCSSRIGPRCPPPHTVDARTCEATESGGAHVHARGLHECVEPALRTRF